MLVLRLNWTFQQPKENLSSCYRGVKKMERLFKLTKNCYFISSLSEVNRILNELVEVKGQRNWDLSLTFDLLLPIISFSETEVLDRLRFWLFMMFIKNVICAIKVMTNQCAIVKVFLYRVFPSIVYCYPKCNNAKDVVF